MSALFTWLLAMTMPTFLIIGAEKAGTTSLYWYLKQHPEIFMSSVKEPRFFAFEDEELNFAGPKNTINASITKLEDYVKLFEQVEGQKAIGEASPLYLYIPKACFRIKHYIPNAKLIAILRNPIDRAYSQYLHQVRDDKEPIANFIDAVKLEEERIRNNWATGWHYLSKGFYYSQLKLYYENFDQQQIKVYLYEDLTQPLIMLQDIFQFLDVTADFLPDTETQYNISGIPKNKFISKSIVEPVKSAIKKVLPTPSAKRLIYRINKANLYKPSLSQDVKAQLKPYFRDDVLKLQDLIGRDLSHWL